MPIDSELQRKLPISPTDFEGEFYEKLPFSDPNQDLAYEIIKDSVEAYEEFLEEKREKQKEGFTKKGKIIISALQPRPLNGFQEQFITFGFGGRKTLSDKQIRSIYFSSLSFMFSTRASAASGIHYISELGSHLGGLESIGPLYSAFSGTYGTSRHSLLFDPLCYLCLSSSFFPGAPISVKSRSSSDLRSLLPVPEASSNNRLLCRNKDKVQPTGNFL